MGECSYAQAAWPAGKGSFEDNLGPASLHNDVLSLLSRRPAKPLADLLHEHRETYREIIVALPDIRWTVHTPHMRCSQVREVASYLTATRSYKLFDDREQALVSAGVVQRRGMVRRAMLLQRKYDEGRMFENLEKDLEPVRRNLQGQIKIETVTSEVLRKASWTKQFWMFSRSHLIAGSIGGGLAWLWALPRGGGVIEFLPYGVEWTEPCSGHWNDAAYAGAVYAGFAHLAGIHHICTVLEQPSTLPHIALPGPPWKGLSLRLDPVEVERLFREFLELSSGTLPPCDR